MPVIFISRPFSKVTALMAGAAATSGASRREALDRDVLVRPRQVPALLVRGVPRPVGIIQVAASEHAEISAPGRQDTVDVVIRGDVADRHRRHVGLVADAIAERRLIEPAVYGLLVGRRLAGRYGNDVTAVLAEPPREIHRVVRGNPT